jgi:hypothetical protein
MKLIDRETVRSADTNGDSRHAIRRNNTPFREVLQLALRGSRAEWAAKFVLVAEGISGGAVWRPGVSVGGFRYPGMVPGGSPGLRPRLMQRISDSGH